MSYWPRQPRSLLLVLSLATAFSAQVALGVSTGWPSLDAQLQADSVRPGSALERLIRANQDFSVLREGEAKDKILVPLWLRVLWRKAHPEAVFPADDPTGGYPFVLKEVHEWMVTHQDLEPGVPEADAWPEAADP